MTPELRTPRHPDQRPYFVRVGKPYREAYTPPERATVRGVIGTLRLADLAIAGMAIAAPLVAMGVVL
jgi:hypothetical protein